MRVSTRISFLLWAAMAAAASTEQAPEHSALPSIPTYVCRKATGDIQVDGKLNEGDWKGAEEIQLLDNSGKGAAMRPKTSAKMLWDEKNLYVAFVSEDSDIRATMKQRDQYLWTEEVVEIFVGRTDMYIEIEVNPLNTLFDGLIDLRGQTGRPKFDVDAIARVNFDIKHETVVEGTVENPKDKDVCWVVELAIPHTALKDIHPVPPKDGHVWRLNLYRIDRSLEAGKVTSAAGAWSPTGGWFHDPARFGKLIFRSGR
jgi:hypothetical protein